MFQVVTAVRFAQRFTSGRTNPPLFGCEISAGEEIEVVVKLSGTDCGLHGVVREGLMALLAVDLGLPVSDPLLVQLADGFIEALPCGELLLAKQMRGSVFPTFGSRKFPGAFAVWGKERPLPDALVEQAAEIFTFDALTLNPDRRAQNPNCLCNGTTFAIFDHECGLRTEGLGTVLLPCPWQRDGLRYLTTGNGEHVLYHGVRRRGAQLGRLHAVWSNLSDARLNEYRAAVPVEWANQCPEVIDEGLMYLRELQKNLDQAIGEVRRVLA